MPVARVSSKGQITIPKEIRDALHLKINDKVALVVEGGVAIIKPIRGNILDIGASVKIPGKSKPVDFKKVRKEVIKKVAGRAAARGR